MKKISSTQLNYNSYSQNVLREINVDKFSLCILEKENHYNAIKEGNLKNREQTRKNKMEQPVTQIVENILSDTKGRKGEKRKTITWNYIGQEDQQNIKIQF